eukprot:TRINITY_DN60620_c0_g1_i2.p2 TRINITY_DN60620_c0_g1~~TRINITY_DN60620_c0_g1_i2.p2  ORF type:complete len:105 (-),score=41.41 TRINITY_DN60620_c0_g1_i2:8-322(-)
MCIRDRYQRRVRGPTVNQPMLKVKTLNGRSYAISMAGGVVQLRQELAARINCTNPQQIKLVHKGKVLPMEGSFDDAGVQDGDKLLMAMSVQSCLLYTSPSPRDS